LSNQRISWPRKVKNGHSRIEGVKNEQRRNRQRGEKKEWVNKSKSIWRGTETPGKKDQQSAAHARAQRGIGNKSVLEVTGAGVDQGSFALKKEMSWKKIRVLGSSALRTIQRQAGVTAAH